MNYIFKMCILNNIVKGKILNTPVKNMVKYYALEVTLNVHFNTTHFDALYQGTIIVKIKIPPPIHTHLLENKTPELHGLNL